MAISEIGLSRRQRVFVVLEDTTGTLKFPSASDFIRPAGNAVMNQNPDFSDSEELQDTLDVLDRFQNAMPAAEWTIPMYVRPHGTLGSSGHQGSALFQSLQGSINAATMASLSSNITAAGTTIPYRGLSGGSLPERGVVLIGTEYIRYTAKSATNATQGNLTGCQRAYSGTAATHATGDSVDLSSTFYKQTTTKPSVSIWIESDHFTQALSGATVSGAKLSVTNEGAVKIEWSGGGMQMVWAGTSALAAGSTTTTNVVVDDAKLYKAGAYIQNYSQLDTRTGQGYKITAVNVTSNTLTLANAHAGTWAKDDVIKGYLPTATVIGDPIESRRSAVLINGVSATFRSGELNINAPADYITDEIGTEYPQGYMENVREITSTMGLYFRQADAKYFTDGYRSGSEVPVDLTFGQTAGKKFEVYLKKSKLEVPTIEIAAPALALSIPLKALGTSGEDSCELYFL